jgi:CTP:molybdopterin cytidylyltransferase MocA
LKTLPHSLRIGCAVLAAGSSKRLGRPKQLLSYCGAPLIHRIGAEVLASGCHAAAVVTGCSGQDVGRAVAALAIETLDNPRWSEGVAASIRVATEWAAQRELDGLLLAACDQLHLSAAHLAELMARCERVTDIVASGYAGTAGIPALFGAAWYPQLLHLQGDRGAGELLRANAATQLVAWPAGEHDIDTEHDIARIGHGFA